MAKQKIRPLDLKKDKHAQITSLLWAVGLIALVIIISLFVAIGSGITIFFVEQTEEIVSGLGMVETTNMTAVSDMTFGNLNTVVQMLKWGSGVGLMICILGILILASQIRMNPSAFLIGFYIVLILVLVLLGIFVSNIYEEFRAGSDEIALQLQQMPLTSFIIVYFPMIITIVGFIGGIFIFSGLNEEFV